MAREKWSIILNKGVEQGRFFTKSDVDDWLKPYYYGGLSSGYASQILQRMVKDGCITRVKIGHYHVVRSPKPQGGKSPGLSISTDPAQTSLF